MARQDENVEILEAHFKQWKEAHLEEWQEFQDRIREAVKHLNDTSPQIRDALLSLGEHGWYLDLKMLPSSLQDLKEALDEGNITEAEDALIEYFESQVDEIEKSIVGRFPKRAKLIKAAFNAHRKGEYDLSIPVVLAQTDGICKEVVNESLFIRYKKKPRTAIYVEKVTSNPYKVALLSPLTLPLPIGASEHERHEGFNELNRHMVLHGESLDYGSKKNSLKAISLINYVAHVLKFGDDF